MGPQAYSQVYTHLSEMRQWVAELIRLERLVMGEPQSIEERRQEIEVQVSIEERLKQYAPVFQELVEEGIIRLEGQAALVTPEDLEEGEDGEDDTLTYDELDDEQGPS